MHGTYTCWTWWHVPVSSVPKLYADIVKHIGVYVFIVVFMQMLVCVKALGCLGVSTDPHTTPFNTVLTHSIYHIPAWNIMHRRTMTCGDVCGLRVEQLLPSTTASSHSRGRSQCHNDVWALVTGSCGYTTYYIWVCITSAWLHATWGGVRLLTLCWRYIYVYIHEYRKVYVSS